MKEKENQKTCVNHKRACGKLAIIFLSVFVVLTGLIFSVGEVAVDELKYNFSVWTIIILVIIINLVSFLCFMVLFMAYQWVKKDIKPKNKDEIED